MTKKPEFDPDRYLAGDGGFDPDEYLGLKKTPGLGQYTQAAKLAAKIAGETIVDKHPLKVVGKFIADNPGSAGATAMTLAAGPVGIPAAVGVAALGGGGGVAIKQLIDRARGAQAPATSLEAATEIGKEGAIQGAIEGVARGAGKLAEKAVYPAGKKALGFVKRFLKSPLERESADLAVKELGDDVIKPFRGPGAMLEKVEKISADSGKKIGEFLKESGIGFNADDAIMRLEALRPKSSDGKILTGKGYAAENEVIDQAIAKIRAYGPETIFDTYGKPSAAGILPFEDMGAVKTELQGLAKYSKINKTPTERLQAKVAATFKDFLDESLDSVATSRGELPKYGEYLQQKKLYRAAEAAKKALNDRFSKSGNQILDLGDKILAGGGVGAVLTSDDALGMGGKLAALGILRKIATTYGAQTAYSAARAAEKNPALLPAIARTLKITYDEATDGK